MVVGNERRRSYILRPARKRWMSFVSIPFSSLHSCWFCASILSLSLPLVHTPHSVAAPTMACLSLKCCVPSAWENETRGICANPSAQYTLPWYERRSAAAEQAATWCSAVFGNQMNMVDGRDAFYWMRGQNTYVVYFILCIPIGTRRYTICAALWNDNNVDRIDWIYTHTHDTNKRTYKIAHSAKLYSKQKWE